MLPDPKKAFYILIFTLMFSCKGQQEVKKEYAECIKEIIIRRDDFRTKYIESDSLKKASIIIEARNYLTGIMANKVFPYWYGTKWDFNGTTRTPRKGKIACGYFVTNVLTDVGFSIPRVKWAQSASEVFIKKLANKQIKRFSNKPIDHVENYLVKSGSGLYLVGLDSHTGFIYVNNNDVRFIHADYYEPDKGVVSEKLDSFSPIAHSSYRVIGKLMSDDMMISWIKNYAIN